MIKFFLHFIFSIWLLILLIGCDNQVQKLPEGHEATSQTAPDSFSRAFIWTPELGGLGVTVSQPYQVWIQRLQGDKQETLIMESDKTNGLKLTWVGQNVLEICYERAQITHFRNFFVVAEQNYPRIYKVEIVLRKVDKLSDC